MEKLPGYGMDKYCLSAKEKIRAACGCPEAEVYFLSGGTQTNATVIAAALKRYEGVIAASTGMKPEPWNIPVTKFWAFLTQTANSPHRPLKISLKHFMAMKITNIWSSPAWSTFPTLQNTVPCTPAAN